MMGGLCPRTRRLLVPLRRPHTVKTMQAWPTLLIYPFVVYWETYLETFRDLIQ